MPTLSDHAICIRRWDFSETSQTVSMFLRSHGVIRGLAKGAKRDKGGFSGGIDLLARGHVVVIVKPGRDLANLTQWDHQQSYVILRESLTANRAAWFMADLVHHMITDHDPHPVVYDGLVRCLDALADTDAGRVLLRFQTMLLSEAGYQPQLVVDTETGDALDQDAETLAFSPSAGGVVADTGTGDRWRVRTETVQLLRSVAAGEGSADAKAEIIDRANRLLAAYLREIIGVQPRSWEWVWEAGATQRNSDAAT